MDVTLSKKAKLIIAVVLVIAAAPLYLASNIGMEKICKSQWDRADDPKAPVNLYKAMVFYGVTWREEKMEQLAIEWLKHYGGDETEKDVNFRYQSWGELSQRTFPYDGDTMKRPPQKGEDFRPDPHPLTAKVLILWANNLENGHRLQEAVHIYTLIANEQYCSQWKLNPDPESVKAAVAGIQRNGTGSRSF